MTEPETTEVIPEAPKSPPISGADSAGNKPIAPVYMLLIVALLGIMGFQVYLIFKNLSNKPGSAPVAGGQNPPPVGQPPGQVPNPGMGGSGAPGGGKLPPPSGAPSNVPGGQPVALNDGVPIGPAGLIFGGIVALNSKDDLKLTADQKKKMATALQSQAASKGAFTYFKTVADKTLTPAQIELVKAGSSTPPPPLMGAAPAAGQPIKPEMKDISDPTWISALTAVATVAGKKPEEVQAATIPAGTAGAADAPNGMNAAAYARGLIAMIKGGKEALTKTEAEALLPALKAAVDADASEARLKKELVGVLNDKQKAYLVSNMQPMGQPGQSGTGMPILAGLDQVLYAVTDGKEGSQQMAAPGPPMGQAGGIPPAAMSGVAPTNGPPPTGMAAPTSQPSPLVQGPGGTTGAVAPPGGGNGPAPPAGGGPPGGGPAPNGNGKGPAPLAPGAPPANGAQAPGGAPPQGGGAPGAPPAGGGAAPAAK